jgi:1-acyl-sn-glycerol-3-phosphate acyltransferase
MPQTRAGVLRWLGRIVGTTYGRDPASFDAAAVEQTMRSIGELAHFLPWFPVEVRGLEDIPPPPAMLVMNHSGGTSIPDVWGFLVAWYRHFGTARPIHPLAHDLVVGQPLTGGWFERRGVLLANRRIARRAITEHRRDVLVLPGGDAEAWRPFRARWRVDFAGRRGYARLAVETGVPIVPVAHAGAHETLVVLSRGGKLARRIGLHRIARADIFPVHLSLPWGLAIGPLPHLPLPTPLRYRVGPAIPTGGVVDPGAERLDQQVRASIQRQLDALADEEGAHGFLDRARWILDALRATRAAWNDRRRRE